MRIVIKYANCIYVLLIGASTALFNISAIVECRSLLVEEKVHLTLLDHLQTSKDLAMKSSFLQVIVQMSSSSICVQELLEVSIYN